jgi:hypothetical protein
MANGIQIQSLERNQLIEEVKYTHRKVVWDPYLVNI